jgi:hypothetical protein
MHVAKGVAESLKRRERRTFGREQPLQYLGFAGRLRGADGGTLKFAPAARKGPPQWSDLSCPSACEMLSP